jgi:dUTPase
MEKVNIKYKRTHTLAAHPKKATNGSVAVDLIAVDASINYEKGYIEYRTGLHIELPPGYGALHQG